MTRALGLLLALPIIATAAPLSQLDEEHQLRRSYVTPHVNWGKPWFAGPMKVLLLGVGAYGGAPRDAVEMMERFDWQITPVWMESNRKVVHFANKNADVEVTENPPDSDGVQRLRRLLGQKWDLFVFGGINPDVLPAEMQYYIYKQVAEGAGLVCIGEKPTKIMLDKQLMADPQDLFPFPGVQFWELPTAQAWAREDEKPVALGRRMVHAYKLGKGRGVYLALPNPPMLTPNTPATPENINELEYWYALVGQLGLWAAGRGPSIVAPPKEPVVLRVRLARLDGWTSPWIQLKGDEKPPKPSVPTPAGQYWREITESVGGRVFNFGVMPVTMRGEGPQAVTEIKLATDFCEPGDWLRVNVQLASADYSGCSLRVETRDSWGRVLARSDQPLGSEKREADMMLPTTDDCSIYMRLEATIWKGERQLTAPKAVDFRVTQRRRGLFHQVMWDAADTAVGYWAMLKLRECGFDVDLRWGTSSTVAMADMPLIPYTTRIMESLDANGIMQPCCWNDLDAVKKWMDDTAKPMDVQRKHGAFVYSLGDETTTQGVCLSPECMAAYRKYLQAQYGETAALNKSWGSTYTSFDDVQLSSPKDNYEAEALRTGNYARWFDREDFAQYNYLLLNARFGERYRQLDPKALTGFEGAGGFGDDVQGIVTTNGFWNPYPSLADELVNSVAPNGYLRANWMGYQRTADPLNYWYWRMIVNGSSAAFFWRWDGMGIWHGYLAPDFEPYAATEDLTRDSEVVREGLGDLIMHADKIDDGIAFYYSVASAQVDKLPGQNLGGVQRAHEAWANLTRATGYGFRYVSEKDIEAGALSKYKVLVLPATRAISDKAADAIRKFVQAGGAVVADLRPGDFTEHLAKRPAPILADLFGDTSAQPTVAKAPDMRVHTIGAGKAMMLNCSVADMNASPSEASGLKAREFIASLYASLGVKPAARLVSDDPKVLLHSGSWRDGKMILYAAQTVSYDHPGRYTLALAEPMHTYDLRDAKYLGKRDKVDLAAVRTRFMILSPTPLKPVTASLKRGENILVTVRKGAGNPDGLYGASVRLYDPSGAEQLWARRNVVVKNAIEVPLVLGLRPASGKWIVKVRDLATGVETALSFNVAGSNPAIWPGCYRPRE